MSTLPHLPTLLRKTVALSQLSNKPPVSLNSGQNVSLSATLPTSNSKSQLIPLSPKHPTIQFQKPVQQIDTESQNQLIELQALLDLAIKRYEMNLAKLRSLDRNFNLNLRKIEQINARAIARVADRISAFSSEIEQLKTQKFNAERKINYINKAQSNTEKEGFNSLLQPLQKEYDDFEKEFNKAQNTVSTLFQSLEQRTLQLISNYNHLSVLPKHVDEIVVKINDLQQDSNKTNEIFEISTKEIEENIKHQQQTILTKIQETKANMDIRLKLLQERVNNGLNQSEDVSKQSNDSQIRIKEDFNENLFQIIGKYQKQIDNLRKKVNQMSNSRYSQIQELRDRIKQSTKKLEDIKHSNMMSWVNANPPKRISLRPEIDRLKAKCMELEKRINEIEIEKGIRKEIQMKEEKANLDKPFVRLFYQFLDDDSLKLALVLSNGTVFFG